MDTPDDWQRLVEALDAWTSAAEIAPGRIEVTLPQDPQGARAVIVMTADEWEDMSGVMWGSFDEGLAEVKQKLLELGPEERFAVYSQYRLVASTEPRLPKASPPTPPPGGAWVAYDGEGRRG